MKKGPTKSIIHTVVLVIGVVAAVFLVASILESVILACLYGLDLAGVEEKKVEERYVVTRLGAKSSRRGGEEDYIFWRGNKIILYTLETGKTAEYEFEKPERKGIEPGVIIGSQAYYALTDHSVRRFDWEKQTDEEIFSEKEILDMCGWEEWPEASYIYIKRSKDCFWLQVCSGGVIRDTDIWSEAHIYICPVEGDMKTDCMEVNTLFPEEDRTGRDQVIRYQDLRIRRYYDERSQVYRISELREAKQRIIFRKWGQFSYHMAGKPEEREITCLSQDSYSYAHLQDNDITEENGEFIGLLQVPKNIRCDPINPPQDELKYDVLFRLEPQTGESSILYSPWNKSTRIIGYQDGMIYLLRNFKIYSRAVESEEEKQIAELPKDTYYEFDWQGDYLIVINRDGIYGAYKVLEEAREEAAAAEIPKVETEKSHTILAADICAAPRYDYENTPLAEYIEADIAWNKEMEEKMGESFPLEIDYHLFDFNGDGVEDYLLCEEGRLFDGLAGNSVEIFIQEEDGVRCVLSRLMRLHTPSGHNKLSVLDEKTDGYYAIAPPWGGEIPRDAILRYHAETGRYECGIKGGWHSVMPEDSDFVHFRDLARNHDILAYDICSSPKYDYENTPLADYIEEEFVTYTEELSKSVGEQISVEIDYHLFDFNGDGVEDYLLCVSGSPFCGSGGNHVEIYIQEEDGVRQVLNITERLHVSLSEHEMLMILDEKNDGYYALAFEESNYILRYNAETGRYDFIR